MALQLGDVAPDFTADTTMGPLHFHSWLEDGWAMAASSSLPGSGIPGPRIGICLCWWGTSMAMEGTM